MNNKSILSKKSWVKKVLSFLKKNASQNKGLTMIEILLVMGILAVLFAIAALSISNIRIITTNNTSTSVIISDLKNQQIKAMAGDTEGRGVPDNYGMKVLSDKYVLFHGLTYNPADATNFAVPVDTGSLLSTTFQNGTIIFASESGDLVNFVLNQNSITISNTSTNQTKTITLNKYGTVTSIN